MDSQPAQSNDPDMSDSAPMPGEPEPVSGLGVDANARDRMRQQNERSLDTKRREILEAARAKFKAEYLESSSVPPSPTSAAPAQSTIQQVVPQAQQALPSQLSEQVIAFLGAQAQQAQRAREEATTAIAAAERRAQEADARIAQFSKNPVAFLQAEGINPDQWQARLMNGGEQTPEERIHSEVQTRVSAEVAPLQDKVNQLNGIILGDMRAKAIAEVTPLLAKDFPLFNKLMGPEAAIDHFKAEAAKAQANGKPRPDPKQLFQAAETQLRQQYMATLQDPGVASILGVSVKSQPAVVAAQNPQTLNNRATSTVRPPPSGPQSDRERIARGRELERQLRAQGLL